jgi:hypothetical protein
MNMGVIDAAAFLQDTAGSCVLDHGARLEPGEGVRFCGAPRFDITQKKWTRLEP